jgi:asparagine synthase (glutamine-hydrolysing)
MSVLFGRWNFDGNPLELEYLEKAKSTLTPYAKDGCSAFLRNHVALLFCPFHTTLESRREIQPYPSPSGDIYLWDGRLDNGSDLVAELDLANDAPDVEIVAAAHAKWETDSFSKILGDWALAVWQPSRSALTLVRDFVGARQLFYAMDSQHITWSTVLDPLVLLAGRSCLINPEYVAGWLGSFPAAHLTPYAGVHSVPPCHFVRLQSGKRFVRKYWDFDGTKRIRYRTDSEYEEHFRSAFRESIRRRLRSDAPVLAELSGGMDSSSIVCVADELLASGAVSTPRLDTLSYYSEAEPNWNERPYFAKVEDKRGRVGAHIDLGPFGFFKFALDTRHFAPNPGSGRPPELTEQIVDCITRNGNRVVLSGIGGDEVLGGVPSPIPELCDLLAQANLPAFARQLKRWSLDKREPWLHLLLSTCRNFLPPTFLGPAELQKPAPWLCQRFVIDQKAALLGYPLRLRLFGPIPSFQENLKTVQALRRRLTWSTLPVEPCSEKRYPYLDRSLLEFLYAIPREQIVRPGQRRSLMRRALSGIVPLEILTRKRKAFLERTPRIAVSEEWNRVIARSPLACVSSGFVDQNLLLEAVNKVRQGHAVAMVPLIRTLTLECWLRHLTDRRLLDGSAASAERTDAPIVPRWETLQIERR